jgi:hypothetical protein
LSHCSLFGANTLRFVCSFVSSFIRSLIHTHIH